MKRNFLGKVYDRIPYQYWKYLDAVDDPCRRHVGRIRYRLLRWLLGKHIGIKLTDTSHGLQAEILVYMYFIWLPPMKVEPDLHVPNMYTLTFYPIEKDQPDSEFSS